MGRVKGIIFWAGLLALLAGCSGPTPDYEGQGGGESGAHGSPVHGGRMVIPMLGDASNLIPNLSSDAGSHSITSQIFVSPLKYDKNLELVPYAAESFEVLEGGKLLRFKLRENVRWLDGHPLTAEDVEFTYQVMVDPETPTAYGGDYKKIKEFRRTGTYTFEVEYAEPYARGLITWAGEIMPKHLLQNEDLTDTRYSREPVGAGPYKLKEWVAGQRIVLQANPDFFLGKPYIDELVYRIIPDQATQFLELKAGNLDQMGLGALDYVFKTTGPIWFKNFKKFKYLTNGYLYMGYNLTHPIFSDKRVRQALAHAVDKQELIKGVRLGQALPAVGPYRSDVWFFNDRIVDYEYDPDKALKMLADAGWEDHDGDNVLDKDGLPFSFTLLTNQGNSERIKVATIIQYRLAQIGIEVEVRALEWTAFLHEFVLKKRFEALILAWNTTVDPDNRTVWHSENIDGGLNVVGYSNPEVDDLLERGQVLLAHEDRKPIYDRLQEVLHEDQPYMFLYASLSLPIIHARIQDVSSSPAGIGHNSDWWWIPAGLQAETVPRIAQ